MTRRMSGVLALFLGILFAPQTDAGTNGGYRYLSPRPGPALVSRETNIIIRHGDLIDPSLLTRPGLFSVVGSASGVHEFRAQLSDDGKTILLVRTEPFAPAEGVTVTIHGGGTTTLGNPLPVHTFTFTTTPLRERIHPSFIQDECDVAGELVLPNAPLNRNASADTLPSDFPAITIDTISTPAPGYLFMRVSDDVPGVGERGAGETLACGTGAYVAAVAGIRRGLLDSPVEVETRGGRLTIAWEGQGRTAPHPVRLTGPATRVFEGEIEI